MKEIKFRAWDKIEQKFESSFSISDRGKFYRLGVMQNDSNIEIMQYTGLKDKNGVYIYEGDIVKAISDDEHNENVITDIIFNEGWEVRSRDDKKAYNHGLNLKWGGWESIEVIGNIHENKELL